MYENETYEELLNRTLSRFPSTIDTRQSSFAFNSSASVMAELQNVYLALDNILNITSYLRVKMSICYKREFVK